MADRLAEKEGETALFPALQNLGRGIKSALPNLRHSIRHCIEVSMIPCNAKKGQSAASVSPFACLACTVHYLNVKLMLLVSCTLSADFAIQPCCVYESCSSNTGSEMHVFREVCVSIAGWQGTGQGQ